MSKLFEREDVRTLLEWLLENQDTELSPELDPSRGYIYPELEKMADKSVELGPEFYKSLLDIVD